MGIQEGLKTKGRYSPGKDAGPLLHFTDVCSIQKRRKKMMKTRNTDRAA